MAASLAALVALAPPPAQAQGKCTCDDLRQYLDLVERKRDCYKKMYEAAKAAILFTESDNRALFESCMNFVPGSSFSMGKPAEAPAEEVKQAKDKCRQENCEWICGVAVEQVHEKFHTWFNGTQRMSLLVFFAHPPITMPAAMQAENNLGEVGAHEAEADFLRDRINDAVKNGECADVRKTVDQAERDRRIQEAAKRLEQYLAGLEAAQ